MKMICSTCRLFKFSIWFPHFRNFCDNKISRRTIFIRNSRMRIRDASFCVTQSLINFSIFLQTGIMTTSTKVFHRRRFSLEWRPLLNDAQFLFSSQKHFTCFLSPTNICLLLLNWQSTDFCWLSAHCTNTFPSDIDWTWQTAFIFSSPAPWICFYY